MSFRMTTAVPATEPPSEADSRRPAARRCSGRRARPSAKRLALAILASTMVAGALGAGFAAGLPDRYVAQAAILADRSLPRAEAAARMQGLAGLVGSRAMAERLLADPGVGPRVRADLLAGRRIVGAEPIDRLISGFLSGDADEAGQVQQRISVSGNAVAGRIDVTVTSGQAALARDVANRLLDLLRTIETARSSSIAAREIAWIDASIADLGADAAGPEAERAGLEARRRALAAGEARPERAEVSIRAALPQAPAPSRLPLVTGIAALAGLIAAAAAAGAFALHERLRLPREPGLGGGRFAEGGPLAEIRMVPITAALPPAAGEDATAGDRLPDTGRGTRDARGLAALLASEFASTAEGGAPPAGAGGRLRPTPLCPQDETSATASAAEAVRSLDDLRATVMADGSARITILSIGAAPGGASIAEALGEAAAIDGMRAVIVETVADPATSAPGLSEVLSGEAEFADVIQRNPRGRAHHIAAGRRDVDDELMAPARLDPALEALESTYDLVVVDVGSIGRDGNRLGFVSATHHVALIADPGPDAERVLHLLAMSGVTAVSLIAPGELGLVEAA